MKKLPKKFDEKYNLIAKSSNNGDLEKAELIKDLIADDGCFSKIDINLAMNILTFIGYNEEEKKELYPKLLNEALESFKGKYTLI